MVQTRKPAPSSYRQRPFLHLNLQDGEGFTLLYHTLHTLPTYLQGAVGGFRTFWREHQSQPVGVLSRCSSLPSLQGSAFLAVGIP